MTSFCGSYYKLHSAFPHSSPKNFRFLLHTTIDEGNIGTARTPSWEKKTGLKYCRIKQVLNTVHHKELWKKVILSLLSPPFPTLSIWLRAAMIPARSAGLSVPGRACQVWSKHRQCWDSFPQGTQAKAPLLGIEKGLSVQNSHWAAKLSRSWKGDVTVSLVLSTTSTSDFPGI